MPSAYNVVVVQPPGYVHSAAFREVAETLVHALRRLGHDATLTGDPAVPGRRPIVLGSNLLPRYPLPLPKDAILYNLEQIDPGSTWLRPELRALFRAHEVWDYSARNAARYAELGLAAPRVVPIGWVPELTRIPRAPREDVDVLFYGSVNERRLAILRALQARGLAVEAHYGLYGERRDRLVARAKVILNVHFFEAKVFEIVRVSYLLANGRCVLSERGADADEERAFEPGVAFAPYEGLVERCVELVRNQAERARLAAAGLELMMGRPAQRFLQEALAAGGHAIPLTPPRSPPA